MYTYLYIHAMAEAKNIPKVISLGAEGAGTDCFPYTAWRTVPVPVFPWRLPSPLTWQRFDYCCRCNQYFNYSSIIVWKLIHQFIVKIDTIKVLKMNVFVLPTCCTYSYMFCAEFFQACLFDGMYIIRLWHAFIYETCSWQHTFNAT